MKLWLLLALAFLVQEGTFTVALLYEAQRSQYPLFLIHILWFVLTIVQTYVAYYFGKWVQRKAANTRMEKWIERQAAQLEKRIGKNGEKLALVIVTLIFCPIITAVTASWLDISVSMVLIFTLLGDAIWYASVWATVLGASHLITLVHSLL